LFADLEQVFGFLIRRLPPDLVETISSSLLPGTIHKITTVWLDSAVPSSLQDMEQFQDIIAAARNFCNTLNVLGFSNLGDLQEWTESAPRVWLSKCREAALDSVRTRLSQGLGASRRVEKVEKQVVSRLESEQLAANGAISSSDDHGWDAWDDAEGAPEAAGDDATDKPPEGDDDGTDAWGWGDDEAAAEEPKEELRDAKDDEDEDPTAAWGWGDEANEAQVEVPGNSQRPAPKSEPQTREFILKENYSITSMPQPVLDLIYSIVKDGNALTQDTYANSPVAAAAAGLFSLPTLVLAIFRAISPHYYAPSIGGNM
jgi:centromere/kinetochore protein ZW10